MFSADNIASSKYLQIVREKAETIMHAGFSYSNDILEESADSLVSLTDFDNGKCVFLCLGPKTMDIDLFEPDRYLRRIHFTGSVRPADDGLEALHRAQVGTIPFESFDILLGRGISLDPAALVNKLVRRSRGGYCFERNGLFF